MNIYIYNPNSSGGNYEYALQLKKIYEKNSSFDCKLILPQNVKCKKKDQYFLLPDVSTSRYSFYNKWHFIKRTVLNPIKFYKYLNTAKSGIVLFNDFDQLSVPFWVRLFIKLKNKFKFGVFLHDPDRTNYPPHLVYASYTMSKLLSMMDFVYYHDILPDLSYYNNFRGLKIPVPHGLYYLPNPDIELKKRLIEWKGKKILLGILGNIREEKNYT